MRHRDFKAFIVTGAALVGLCFLAARPASSAHNSPAPEADGADIAAVIRLVIKAYGGDEAIMSTAEHFARGRIRDESTGRYKTYAHYIASRTRFRVDISDDGRSETMVLNSRRATFTRYGFLPERMEGMELLNLRFEYLCVSIPRILASEQYRARDLKAVPGEDGPGYEFRLELAGMPDVTVEVDAGSGLIRKIESVLAEKDEAVLAGMRMSGYREVSGTLLPVRMTRLEDGHVVSSREILAYSPGASMSARLFE